MSQPPDPQAVLRAMAKRLDERARQELELVRDEYLNKPDREIARIRAIACQVVAEEAVVSLSEPDRSAKP